MIKLQVLASGSKGNATYLETNEIKMLIDAGVGIEYLKKSLSKINVKLEEITHILITHIHSDHVRGLEKIIKYHQPIIYLTKGMQKELKLDKYPRINYYEPTLKFANTEIRVFRTSHDTEDSFAFVVNSTKSSLVYITDTGYLNLKYFKHLKNKEIYVIESNHDVEMLMNGKYPYHLKKRVLGDRGHLSNQDCAYYLNKLVGKKTKHIILSHLSQENNCPKIAYKTTKKATTINPNLTIHISKQTESTELIEV